MCLPRLCKMAMIKVSSPHKSTRLCTMAAIRHNQVIKNHQDHSSAFGDSLKIYNTNWFVKCAVPRFCIINDSIGTKRVNNKNYSIRRLLFILTLIFFSIHLTAQEHLTFKGIPIEGSMSEFCQKLKAKGLTLINKDIT